MKPTPAILYQAYVAAHLRCLCPICLSLDARYPNEGYQLALFPYRLEKAPRERLIPAASDEAVKIIAGGR